MIGWFWPADRKTSFDLEVMDYVVAQSLSCGSS